MSALNNSTDKLVYMYAASNLRERKAQPEPEQGDAGAFAEEA
jgi:hypothetical protein